MRGFVLLIADIILVCTKTKSCDAAMVSHKVFCFGDSLTTGTSPPLNDDFPFAQCLEKKLRSNPVFGSALVRWKGLPGWTASALERDGGLLGNIDQIQASVGKLDLVIILAGTTDLAYETDSEVILDAITRIHGSAHSRGVKTIAVSIPPSGWQLQSESTRMLAETVNSKLQSWTNDSGLNPQASMVTFVPFPIKQFDRSSGLWSSDGLHFSPEGYKYIGEALATTVSNILSETNVG